MPLAEKSDMGDLFGWALTLKGMYRDCAAMNKAKADALKGLEGKELK